MPLALYWKAQFADGSTLRQQDVEHLPRPFGLVMNRVNELVELSLEGQGRSYSVNLFAGRFSIGGFEVPVDALPGLPAAFPNLRFNPVYFRRMVGTLDGKRAVAAYFLGWSTTYGGRNYKCAVRIDPATGDFAFLNEF